MPGEVSDPVKCGDVRIEGKTLAAVTARVTDGVRVELRDARHVSDLFSSYHFVIKFHTGDPVHVTDNALLVEVDRTPVKDLEYHGVSQLIQTATAHDFVVFKLVLFPVYVLHVASPSSLPPLQMQFRVKTVPHDTDSFFYALTQSLEFGHAQVEDGDWQRATARRWRHMLWNAWQKYWAALSEAQRKQALQRFHASYPLVPQSVDPSQASFWLQDDVSEFHIRFLSEVAKIKIVIYGLKSTKSWDAVSSMPLVTDEDLTENGHLWRTVVGAAYTTMVYLLNVYDESVFFQHFASLIPVPYLPACA